VGFVCLQKVAFCNFRNAKVQYMIITTVEYGEVLLGSEKELGGIVLAGKKKALVLLFSILL
jgi:hypothetical protein